MVKIGGICFNYPTESTMNQVEYNPDFELNDY